MTIEHTDVGAYALGLLEEGDRRVFEGHLLECADCVEDLRGLSGMRDLLRDLGPIESWPDDLAVPVDLADRRPAPSRRRRVGRAVLGAAASLALLIGGAAVGTRLATPTGAPGDPVDAHHSPAESLLRSGERHTATDAETGVGGTVALEKKDWGTHVALELANVRGPLACRLVAVTRSGERRPVTSWTVPPRGYGVPGSPDPLQVHGAAQAPRQDIAEFEVLVEDGATLVIIPV